MQHTIHFCRFRGNKTSVCLSVNYIILNLKKTLFFLLNSQIQMSIKHLLLFIYNVLVIVLYVFSFVLNYWISKTKNRNNEIFKAPLNCLSCDICILQRKKNLTRPLLQNSKTYLKCRKYSRKKSMKWLFKSIQKSSCENKLYLLL